MSKMRTPSQLFHYYSGVKLDKQIEMWKVQTESSEDRKGYWVGQIMTGMAFDDSPDCEFISGGKSVKDITGMALGRCGNLFHWGFSASPAFMTESAKQVFVNTVFYMAQFNGKKSIVKRYKSSGREWVDEKCYRESHLLIDHKTGKCPSTGNAERDKVLKYYTENYNYFYFKGRSLTPVLDKEAKSLGIANNDVRLLEKCVEMLEKGNETEKALILLKRYTENNFEDVKQWRKWLNKYKDYLFFTEMGGYKFLVDTWNHPELGNNITTSKVDIEETESDSEKVVQLKAELKHDGGNRFTLYITANIKEGWHIYAKLTAEASYFINTDIKINIPKGVRLKGKIEKPKTVPYKSVKGVTLYEGKSVFKQKLIIDNSKFKGEKIECMIKYQACDEYMCQAPEEKKLVVKVE